MNFQLLMLAPPVLRDFLSYNETIKGKSEATVREYFMDLQTFFRYLKVVRGQEPQDKPFEEIKIDDVDISLLKTVTLSDLYAFLVFCKDCRQNNASTRARKCASLRMFFRYLTLQVHLLDVNPAELLETPKLKKSLPKHLSLEQSVSLLDIVEGPFAQRDYCILTLFLNCGLRLSELCGLNVSDVHADGSMRILGKGNKERTVYLNDACLRAIEAYLPHRAIEKAPASEKKALFLSRLGRRISPKTVQYIVNKYLEKAGMGAEGFSVHKLRHTAATLMYQHGHVDIRVLKDVLGHENLGTTQIYTHVADQQVRAAIEANPLAKTKQKKDGQS